MTWNEAADIRVQVANWIEDLGDHAQAADAIAALGTAAIAGLNAYLAGDPQVIPQPRSFAVKMLARLHAEAATSALRAVLHAHPLKTLEPRLAESEYVVKSDALEALCERPYAEFADDLAWGVHERLRVAVVAAGTLGPPGIADALVDLLDDDVLAEAAVESLARRGAEATAVIVPRLDAWLTGAKWSARQRLALLRALRVLHRVHATLGATATRRTAAATHPALRGAAALLVAPMARDGVLVEALVRGAVGCDRALADECRDALESVAPALLIEPARRVLRRDAEPDLYGEPRPLSRAQRDWLERLTRDDGKLPDGST